MRERSHSTSIQKERARPIGAWAQSQKERTSSARSDAAAAPRTSDVRILPARSSSGRKKARKVSQENKNEE